MSDRETLDTWSARLYSAVVSDACDQAGLRSQVAHSSARPTPGAKGVLVGFARPVRSVEVTFVPDRPYQTEVAYVDSLGSGDVVVATTGGSPSGFWGELFSTAAVGRGARGAIIDGLVRDQVKIADLDFDVFAIGGGPADSLGRLSIVEQDEPVEFGGVSVARGDLVVADVDGIVIVPAAAVADVIERALAKASIENQARELLLSGSKLADVWERFRVL